jgi:hypothetical protein
MPDDCLSSWTFVHKPLLSPNPLHPKHMCLIFLSPWFCFSISTTPYPYDTSFCGLEPSFCSAARFESLVCLSMCSICFSFQLCAISINEDVFCVTVQDRTKDRPGASHGRLISILWFQGWRVTSLLDGAIRWFIVLPPDSEAIVTDF